MQMLLHASENQLVNAYAFKSKLSLVLSKLELPNMHIKYTIYKYHPISKIVVHFLAVKYVV